MSVINPVLFLGEQSLGTTAGAPLSTDANNQLISGIQNAEVSATATINVSSSTDALMSGMTTTPVAGTYLVIFSCDLNSGAAGAAISVSYYVGGTQVASSLRKIIPFSGGTLTSGSARAMACLNSIIAVNGSQAIEVRWSTSSGTISAASRTLDIVRLA